MTSSRSSPSLRPGPGADHAGRPTARRAHRLRDPRRPPAGPAPRTSSRHSPPTTSTATVDSTHAGLLEDQRRAAESVRAITDVIAAVRTGSPLDADVTSHAGRVPANPTTHTPTRGVPMSHTTQPTTAHRAPQASPRSRQRETSPTKSWALLGSRPRRPDPGRARHLGRQHRTAVHRRAPCTSTAASCSGWSPPT